MYQRLLAQVYAQPASSLGFVSATDDNMAGVGITYADTWTEGIDHVTALWSLDVDRRTLLRGFLFSAAACGGPVLRWLVADDGELVSRDSGSRLVRDVDIATIRNMTTAYRGLDNQHGGGSVRESAVRYLHHEVAPLLKEARFDKNFGGQLLQATAELTQLVGWMTYDAADHGAAQRYLLQALRLAQAAGDRALGAEILAAMSHQASYVGEGATAVDLARAAGRTAREVGVPALVAEAAVLEAQGHATRADEAACTKALTAAETALDRADRAADPQWISYFDEAYLSAKFGHCFKALGRPNQTAQFAERSLDMDPKYVRGRAFNLSLLATAHAEQGNVEAACTVGRQAAAIARQLDSVRAVEYVSEVAGRLAPFAGQPDVDRFRCEARQLSAVA